MAKVAIPHEKKHSMFKARLLAPFAKRYAIRNKMQVVPEDIRNVYQHMIMSQDKKILFLKNSKAGCTSVAHLIIKYSTGTVAENVHRHSDGVYHAWEYWEEFDQAFASPDTYCFSMVRNPQSRLLSGFTNFFVDVQNRNVGLHLSAMESRGYEIGGEIGKNLDVFLDYVAESVAGSPTHCDPHWREQHRNLGLSYFQYDFVARLENFNKDIQHAFESAGLGEFLKTQEWQKKRNSSSRLDLVLRPDQIAKIEKIYAADYEKFGY